jgi:hypothetical protein
VAVVIGLLLAGRRAIGIVDTEEMLLPDPRGREVVHLRALSGQLQAYARDHGVLPERLSILGAEISRPDEWGTAIRYEHTGAVLDLRSAGPDRRFGTTDDIVERGGTTYASKRALYLERQDSARKDR